MKKSCKIALLSTLLIITGCETGVKNKISSSSSYNDSTESGIVSKGSKTYSKPYSPKSSEIRKIYSTSGIPGYYIQVGYFKEHQPTGEFINRMEFSQLPYKLLKKYNLTFCCAESCTGGYISYLFTKKPGMSAKDFVTSKAFIVKLVRP